MHYGNICKEDINGRGKGVSLIIQNDGKVWTQESKDELLNMLHDDQICRVSILGDEPLVEQNIYDVLDLIKDIETCIIPKQIWLYTNFLWEDIFHGSIFTQEIKEVRREVISKCDVLIDGLYIEELKDDTSQWISSRNQRVIDVQESLKANDVIKIKN